MPSSFKLDDPRLAKIARLWAEGVSTSEIGRCLGMPKNTVCSVVFAARKKGDERFPERPSPIGKSRPRGVSFVEVWADGCRFDLGNPEKGGKFQFCNAKTEMGVWCAEHWPRVYNLPGSRGRPDRVYSRPSINRSFE